MPEVVMLLRSLVFGLGLCLMQAFAHDQYGSPRDYGRDNGGQKYKYKQSRDREYRSSAIDQTLADLKRTYSRSRVDSHERAHFQRATEELQTFRYRLADGHRDDRRLDRAMEDLSDLSLRINCILATDKCSRATCRCAPFSFVTRRKLRLAFLAKPQIRLSGSISGADDRT
ncbi:MAG: hypothetical protein WKF37_01260 [Bryobacteraceae bacterium]